MGRITFIIGGARSGKSGHALKLARARGGRVVFLATAQAGDSEMRSRIRRHRAQRPPNWITLEEPLAPAAAVGRLKTPLSCLVVDCLTLLVSNLMLAGKGWPAIEKEVRALVRALRALPAESIVVSNEVGQGIVPQNNLARRFRDAAGRVNQLVAARAEEVVLMTAGIPLIIKESNR